MPASQAAKDARRIRERVKKARKRAKERAAKIVLGRSKTDPAYRRQLPALPEMTKSELRAMIAQAVRNTAGMTA